MRKGMAQGLARPAYYDRNSAPKVSSFAAAITAPHVATTRWTYTVPAGRKAFIEYMQAEALRDGVAGAVGLAIAYINYTPNGSALATVLRADVFNNTLGALNNATIGQFGAAGSGDVFAGTTIDSSTTGTMLYQVAMKVTEYDV